MTNIFKDEISFLEKEADKVLIQSDMRNST